MLVAELFFGRDIGGGGNVSDQAWEEFLDQTLSAHFPDGFTVLDAQGRWRDPDTGKVGSEDTKYVVIAAPDTNSSRAGIDRTIIDYELRFSQKSVGLLLDRRCGAF